MEFKFKAQDVISQGRTSEKAIEAIRSWIFEESDLPKVPDEYIVLFLLSCENDLNFTKKTIRSYYKCKRAAPELFNNRDLRTSELQLALSTIKMASISTRTKENWVVHFFKIEDTNYHNFDLYGICKASLMLVPVSQRNNPPDGLICVIDMKGFGLMHLTKVKIGLLRNYMIYLQEAMPLKMKVIHVLNSVYFFDKVLYILKSVMHSDLINMLKVHPPTLSMEEFFEKHVPADVIPSDYGGKEASLEKLCNNTMDQIKELQPFFEEEESIGKLC